MSSQHNPDALNSYFLPNVPFVQYYLSDGSAIHGTYWHDSFGSSESQGCVNLTTTDAAYLFKLTSPDARLGWGGLGQWNAGAGARLSRACLE